MFLESATLRVEPAFQFKKTKNFTQRLEEGNVADWNEWQRVRLSCLTSELLEENCAKYKQYLSFLQSREEALGPSVRHLAFSWYSPQQAKCTVAGKECQAVTKNSLKFERENVLYNYCIFLIQLGFKLDEKSLKTKCKHFQRALGIAGFLASDSEFLKEDMSLLVPSISYLIQICYLEIYLASGAKASSNSSAIRIINSAISYLTEIQAESSQLVGFWHAVRCYYAGQAYYNAQPCAIGKAMRLLELAIESFERCLKTTESILATTISTFLTQANSLLNRYSRENAMIYNQRIFNDSIDFVKEFGVANLVQGISFQHEPEAKISFKGSASKDNALIESPASSSLQPKETVVINKKLQQLDEKSFGCPEERLPVTLKINKKSSPAVSSKSSTFDSHIGMNLFSTSLKEHLSLFN